MDKVIQFTISGFNKINKILILGLMKSQTILINIFRVASIPKLGKDGGMGLD